MITDLSMPWEYSEIIVWWQIYYVWQVSNEVKHQLKVAIYQLSTDPVIRQESIDLLKVILPIRNDKILIDDLSDEDLWYLLVKTIEKIWAMD